MKRTIPPAPGTSIASLLASVTQEQLQTFKPDLPKIQENEVLLGKLSDDSMRLFFLVDEARLRSNTLIEQMQQLTTAHKQRSQEKDFSRDIECPAYQEAHQKLSEEEDVVRTFHKVLNEMMWGCVRLQFGSFGKSGGGIGITSDFNVVETPVPVRHRHPASILSMLLGVPTEFTVLAGPFRFDGDDEDGESATALAPAATAGPVG
jgi:hypothetical protein